MVVSYFKTSWRSIIRDRLFSVINIFGLAISLSVGLLIVSLLNDLLSYDQFHKQSDRIYRVITTRQHGQSPPKQYASTSLFAGRRIRETFSGIDQLTILEGGFEEDIKRGETVMPAKGFWADEYFFKVFSFRLIEGDPNTALKEPYSVILTETAAKKLCHEKKSIGESVAISGVTYQITGISEDIPMFSHMRFDILVSMATKEIQERENEEWSRWTRISGNYVYLIPSETTDPETIMTGLDKLSNEENLNPDDPKITLALQPLTEIVSGQNLGNAIGPVLPKFVLWILGGLSIVVILCACFNYTSLSIARSLKRAREIGIRKVNGATNNEIFFQFLIEAIVVSLLSLILSLLLFMVLRPQVLSFNQQLSSVVSLSITPIVFLYFVVLAITAGLVGGFLPAIIFMRVNTIESMKNQLSKKTASNFSLRKSLVAIQYTFSLFFICVTVLGYKQYRHFVTFDLGFITDQVVNIDLQGKDSDILVTELKKIPEIINVCRSASIISLDHYSRTQAKYGMPPDSTEIDYNVVDENYLPLHGFKLLAGKNFSPNNSQNSVIVNEQFLRFFHLDTPFTALTNSVSVNGRDCEITGVVADFYYGGTQKLIGPYVFIYSNKEYGFVSVRVSPTSEEVWPKLENAWRVVDSVHPIDAEYYSDQIRQGYKGIAAMLKIIGFLSILTVSIASLGLVGIVLFTTASRTKEIGVRKVLGSSIGDLVYLLSKEFMLLFIAPVILALPAAFFFFDRVVVSEYAYHAPVSIADLSTSLFIVLSIALPVIGIQAWRIARANPVRALRND